MAFKPFPADTNLSVDKNGSFVGAQKTVNFIEGSNVGLVVTDNTGADRIDVTISSTGGGGGGNIQFINSDATPSQVLAVGTSGSDFAVANNGTGTHTFNLPTASASARGALSSADWTAFNASPGPFTATVGFDHAQYICDGTADNVQINAAIVAVNGAGGGTVYIKSGNYDLAGFVHILDNVRIIGDGYSTVLNITTTKTIDFNGVSNSSINNLRIDGATQIANDVALDVKDSSDISVLNIWITSATGYGLFIESTAANTTERVNVQDSYFYGMGNNDVIGGGPANSSGAMVTDVDISNCFVIQDCTSNSYGNAIELVRATRLSVLNNFVRGSVGLSVEQWPHFFSKIQDNFVRPAINKVTCALNVNSTNSATVDAEGIIISGNDVQTGQITLTGVSAGKIKRSIIANNHLTRPTGSGILLTLCDRILCQGNIVSGSSGGSYSGILLTSVSDSIIDSNIISGSDYGINDTSLNTTVRITNNTLTSIAVTPIVGAGVIKNNNGANPEFMYAVGNVTGATNFNRLNGDVQTATLTGNITVTLTDGVGKGDKLSLILTQDGTGSRTASWPGNLKLAGGSLTLSTTAGAIDQVFMEWNGTNWIEVARALQDYNTVSGTGTSTRIAFWSGSSTLSSNANLFWDNGSSRLGVATTSPNSKLHVAGPIATQYAPKNADYTITSLDSIINCTANTFTVTLPTAASIAGRQYIIKNSGAGVITIAANGAETIDGSATFSLSLQYQSITVISNGTNWIIV